MMLAVTLLFLKNMYLKKVISLLELFFKQIHKIKQSAKPVTKNFKAIRIYTETECIGYTKL